VCALIAGDGALQIGVAARVRKWQDDVLAGDPLSVTAVGLHFHSAHTQAGSPVAANRKSHTGEVASVCEAARLLCGKDGVGIGIDWKSRCARASHSQVRRYLEAAAIHPAEVGWEEKELVHRLLVGWGARVHVLAHVGRKDKLHLRDACDVEGLAEKEGIAAGAEAASPRGLQEAEGGASGRVATAADRTRCWRCTPRVTCPHETGPQACPSPTGRWGKGERGKGQGGRPALPVMQSQSSLSSALMVRTVCSAKQRPPPHIGLSCSTARHAWLCLPCCAVPRLAIIASVISSSAWPAILRAQMSDTQRKSERTAGAHAHAHTPRTPRTPRTRGCQTFTHLFHKFLILQCNILWENHHEVIAAHLHAHSLIATLAPCPLSPPCPSFSIVLLRGGGRPNRCGVRQRAPWEMCSRRCGPCRSRWPRRS
jgi:hypothetical protein